MYQGVVLVKEVEDNNSEIFKKEETRDNGLKETSVENPTTDQDREQSRGQDGSTPSSWDSAPSPTPASDSRENSVST